MNNKKEYKIFKYQQFINFIHRYLILAYQDEYYLIICSICGDYFIGFLYFMLYYLFHWQLWIRVYFISMCYFLRYFRFIKLHRPLIFYYLVPIRHHHLQLHFQIVHNLSYFSLIFYFCCFIFLIFLYYDVCAHFNPIKSTNSYYIHYYQQSVDFLFVALYTVFIYLMHFHPHQLLHGFLQVLQVTLVNFSSFSSYFLSYYCNRISAISHKYPKRLE